MSSAATMTTNSMIHRKSSDSCCFRRRRRFGAGFVEVAWPGAMTKLGSPEIVAELGMDVASGGCAAAAAPRR